MKKYILRFLTFIVIFSILFMAAQHVLHYRWTKHEDLYTRYMDYKNQPENSIDVLCFGTSEVFAGYAPIVTYAEEGITGYNFAISHRSAVTNYYQLLFALRYQNPTIVMCDFSSLFDDQLPGDTEALYRKVVDTMPDKDIKEALIKEICLLDAEQSYFSWKYPLLRYHGMWNELNETNFKRDYTYDDAYMTYKKGALLYNLGYDTQNEIYEINSHLWDYDDEQTEFSDVSVKYYDLFIEECKSRGIQVVALIPPKINAASQYAARWNAMKAYFDSRGVDYLNYNTYEQVVRLGVVLEDDYYNAAHLNLRGSVKFSKVLAHDLKEKYVFEDKREDGKISEMWDSAWVIFCQEYNIED